LPRQADQNFQFRPRRTRLDLRSAAGRGERRRWSPSTAALAICPIFNRSFRRAYGATPS